MPRHQPARPRLRPLALSLALLPLGAGAAPAVPDDPAYQAAYQAGYRAALEAARQALAEGKPLPGTEGVANVPAANAESSVAPAPAVTVAAAGKAPAGGEAPDWWNHSSLSAPLRDEWRHGLQVNLSFASLTGNDDGSAWRGGGQFYSRYGRWTNELSANIDKRDIKSADGAVNKRDYRILQEYLRYDLTDSWYAAGGFILEKDDNALVDLRVTTLAGIGRYWLDNERFRFNTYLALGRVNESYMDYVRDHVGVDSRGSGLAYFYQTFAWQMTPEWSLRQGYRLMHDLDESGRYVFDPDNSTPPSAENPQGFERYRAESWHKRYRTVAALDLDYRLGPRSTLSFGIESRYDSNPWPDVLRRDIVRRTTLNLSF